jgi:hypothetical protein
MRTALHTTLAAAIASWTIGAMAAEPVVKPAAEAPQVRVNVRIAEFDEKDRAEIDRVLGTSKGFAGLDEKALRSFEEKKLLRVVTSPAFRTPSGSTASISYEHGEGRDRNGKIQPVMHDITVMPHVEPGIEPTILAEIRCRETVGTGAGQNSTGIDTGAKLKPGETFAIHFYRRPSAAPANAPAAGVGKLLFVTATIVGPKPKDKVYPNPQVGYQASPAKQKKR